MVARVMISGTWRPVAEALTVLNHPGHPNQKSHAGGRGGRLGVEGKDLSAQVDSDEVGRGVMAIGRAQGFDGKPPVASAAELDAAIADGGVEVFRGTRTPHTIDQYRDGPLVPGNGIYGQGTYTSVSESTADRYAGAYGADGDSPGAVVRMVLPKGTRVAEFPDMKAGADKWSADNPDRSRMSETEYAAMKGFDAVRIPADTPGGDGTSNPQDQFVVLNRTAVMIDSTSRTVTVGERR